MLDQERFGTNNANFFMTLGSFRSTYHDSGTYTTWKLEGISSSSYILGAVFHVNHDAQKF